MTGETEDIEFDSVRQAKELFNQCRYLYQRLWNNNRDYNNENIYENDKSTSNKNLNVNKQKTYVQEDGVGKL